MADKVVDYILTPLTRIPSAIQESDAVNVAVPVGTASLDPDKKAFRVYWLDDSNTPHELIAIKKNALEFGATGRAELLGDEADGATAIGTIIGSDVALDTEGALAVSIRVNGVEKARFDKDGALTFGMTPNGANFAFDHDEELLTIAAAASTDSVLEIPAGSLAAVGISVVTAIPGVTSWSGGDSGNASRWGSGLAPTVGTSNALVALTNGFVFFAAATKVRITPDTTPSAATGQVRIYACWQQLQPPTT